MRLLGTFAATVLFFIRFQRLFALLTVDEKVSNLKTYFTGRLFQEECLENDDENLHLTREVEEYVNVLGGTNSHHDISHGNTLPLLTRPWGFNSYAPMTDEDPVHLPWWFHPHDRRFFGMRVTHQPSPWIKDYGEFLIKGYIPTDPMDPLALSDRFSGYSPYQSQFHPYYFSTSLFGYGNSEGNVKIEMTPSQHGGIMRVTFPRYIANEKGDDSSSSNTTDTQLRRIAVSLFGIPGSNFIEILASPNDGTSMISGRTRRNSGGAGDNFSHYFVLAIYNGANGDEITSIASFSSKENNAWVDFLPEDPKNDVLTVRFATSFISAEQALLNLLRETPREKSFDSLLDEARLEWRSLLSRIKVEEPPVGYSSCEIKNFYTIFYTSIFRASIFPRQISEIDKNGNLVHYSPYVTGNESSTVLPGPLSTDSGFWDAWNTVYPLLTLFHRPYLGTVMAGWLTAFDEGGWLPKWSSPGYRGSMIGTMGDVSVSDAIVNDIPGFDTAKAYQAIRKDAYEIPPDRVNGIGRVCLESYLKHGYVPKDAHGTTGTCDQVVSRTLNYYQSDYAIAQAANKLGYSTDATDLLERSKNYSLLFDKQTGFFRSKDHFGRFTTPFDQYRWGFDYTESGPWQYRFYIPFDPQGLFQLYHRGGQNMCDELLRVQTMEYSIYHSGDRQYNEEIEMADHCWGQYAHNNQPSHHMLYMHMYDGFQGACSTQGRFWIREVLRKLYKADVNMYAGDEDNGEMPAWFVLSALGLYQRSPGSGVFEFGVPLFSKVTVDISDISHTLTSNPSILKNPYFASKFFANADENEKKTLTIIAKNNSKDNIYIQKIFWNDQEIAPSANSIQYKLLREGGTLTFELGPSPFKHR